MTAPMTEENDVSQQPDSGDLKRRLLIRVAAAGALIVALLGGLAVLDSMNAPPPATQVAVAPPVAPPEPSPTPPKAEEKPVEQAAVGEIQKPEVPAAEPEVSAPPTQSSAPLKPERPERPLTKPAEARLAMMRPSQPLAAAKRSEPAAELARTPYTSHTPNTGAPASRPLTRPPGQAETFLLQLGVFNSTAHAEELRAKLELNGIPAQIEARVQVGPFSSRLEAEQARDKLKKLGLEGGVLVAVKK